MGPSAGSAIQPLRRRCYKGDQQLKSAAVSRLARSLLPPPTPPHPTATPPHRFQEERQRALDQVVWIDFVCNNQHTAVKKDYGKVGGWGQGGVAWRPGGPRDKEQQRGDEGGLSGPMRGVASASRLCCPAGYGSLEGAGTARVGVRRAFC